MSSASFALQQAVYAKLTATAALTTLLGGQRVYDEVPVRAEFPYVSFGPGFERDWATGSEAGSEHTMTLHVYSRAHGRKEVDDVLALLREALHDLPLTLSGHRLVNLRHEASDARRESDGVTYRGIARFRAVTEVV